MIFKGSERLTNKKDIILKALEGYKEEDSSIHISANVHYNHLEDKDYPEVFLIINKPFGTDNGGSTLWIEYPIPDTDSDNVWIYEKNFGYSEAEAKLALETFFLKVKQVEDLFDIELEVWF